MDLISVFYMQTSSFASNIVEEAVFSLLFVFGVCQKSSEHSCMDSYLSLPFCSTGLSVCFYASTILFFIAIAL
jgi:hypothetical protein